MYRIFADDTLIYDSTLEDYKIGKGTISLEINKSGSFTFSIYPDHFYYDSFVRLKTVITVYRSGKIVFRGRILNDVTDYWNNKVITCEGELGFLQDSIIRPFTFNDTPENLLKKLIEEHNSQVDDFKKFKVGEITVTDPNNYIARSNSGYETALSNLTGRLTGSELGGYFYITHDDNGTDPIPTINYLADFTKVSSQVVEFGSNLKNYTKTVKAEDIATAIIPLGAELSNETNKTKLTIAKVNGGKDYVYSEEGVALYGWIFKVVTWDNVSEANNLKRKAEAYIEDVINQNVTVELNAIDLHLIDRTIESINVCDNVRVISKPHNFDATLLCNKQTLDILKPENDSLVLGYATKTLTREVSSSIQAVQSDVKTVKTEVDVSVGEIRTEIMEETNDLDDKITKVSSDLTQTAEEIRAEVTKEVETLEGDIATVSSKITQTAEEIRSEVSADVAALQSDIDDQDTELTNLAAKYTTLQSSIIQNYNSISAIVSAVGYNGEVTAASIVAAINDSGSYVKIDADHVNITGLVTFEDLETEGATTINGSNIVSGTIEGVTLKSTGSGLNDVEISGAMIKIGTGRLYNGDEGTYLTNMSSLFLSTAYYVYIDADMGVNIAVGSLGRYWKFTTSGIYWCESDGTVLSTVALS